jgi:hypothetical protein
VSKIWSNLSPNGPSLYLSTGIERMLRLNLSSWNFMFVFIHLTHCELFLIKTSPVIVSCLVRLADKIVARPDCGVAWWHATMTSHLHGRGTHNESLRECFNGINISYDNRAYLINLVICMNCDILVFQKISMA